MSFCKKGEKERKRIFRKVGRNGERTSTLQTLLGKQHNYYYEYSSRIPESTVTSGNEGEFARAGVNDFAGGKNASARFRSEQ